MTSSHLSRRKTVSNLVSKPACKLVRKSASKLAGQLATMLAATAASALMAAIAMAAPGECMSESAMEARTRQEGLSEQIRSVQVTIDPEKKAAWDRSTHDFGDNSYSGADLYKLLSFQMDRNNFSMLEYQMKQKGVAPYAIEKGMSELKEYAELKMKDRFYRINTGYQQMFFLTNGNAGMIVTQKNEVACIAFRLTNPVVQHYSLDLPAGWLGKSSRLPKLIAAYRKENRFGVAAFAKTAAGDSLVLLAKPQLGAGSYDGPIPYYFGGVMLIETPKGELSTVWDLMHTKYTGNHQYNFEKK